MILILVDTSVWVDHLRVGEPRVSELLERFEAAMHTFVLGELALGVIRVRDVIFAFLRALPSATVAEDDEVLEFISRSRLWGRGIGYVDAYLLAAVQLSPGMHLWTRDKRLRTIAGEFGVAAAIA